MSGCHTGKASSPLYIFAEKCKKAEENTYKLLLFLNIFTYAYARCASRESDGLNNFLSVNGVYSVLEHLRSSSKSLKQTFGMKREAEVRKAGSSSSIVQKNRGANRLDHIVVLRDAYLLLLNRLSLLLHSFI